MFYGFVYRNCSILHSEKQKLFIRRNVAGAADSSEYGLRLDEPSNGAAVFDCISCMLLQKKGNICGVEYKEDVSYYFPEFLGFFGAG